MLIKKLSESKMIVLKFNMNKNNKHKLICSYILNIVQISILYK